MTTLFRARIFTLIDDPFHRTGETTWRYFEDGYLAVDGALITGVGDWAYRPEKRANDEIVDLGPTHLISPGFVDTHLHAPQLEMIGSYGGQLLEWLNRYTFPTEMKFADTDHAQEIAVEIYEELLSHGTTTALIFSTIHAEATEIFFEEAARRGFRAIIGKVMMDRNAPDGLLEDPEESARQSRAILETWHGQGILQYAITPRFAPTSSERLLELAGELKADFPNVYVQTHISENIPEIKWVRELFPLDESYAGVYDRFGLLDERTILAHGVHLSDAELDLIAERGAKIAHCPNSNLFLGSGLFPLQRVSAHKISFGLGSDIGAGTTPSIISAMADAYKVQQVLDLSLSPFELWYLATLAGARILSLDDVIGSLEEGKDADFIILDLEATRLLSYRTRQAERLQDLLAGCIFIGDDRVVEQSWIRGEKVYERRS